MSFLKRLARELYNSAARDTSVAPATSSNTTSEVTTDLEAEKAQINFDCVSAFEYYNILRQEESVNWCEWHLNITQNENVMKTVRQFHQSFKKLEPSPSIKNQIEIIKKTFLIHMPKTSTWNSIAECFELALKEDNPSPILKAYTISKELSGHINQDSAANTYHAVKLYCTLLNCPILSRTQDYTEAFTNIFFHPELDEFKFTDDDQTVYRGFFLKDKKFVANYRKGALIITTAFLSTSTDRAVAEMFGTPDSADEISIFCTYKLKKQTNHRTALDLRKVTHFEHEAEILILRYVPFRIQSIERTNDDRRMNIDFVQCNDSGTIEE